MKKESHITASKKKETVKSNGNPVSNYFLWVTLIIITTLIAYFPSLNNEFTNWDDDLYVTANPLVQNLSAQNIKIFFSEFRNGNYHPLTLLSLAIDYSISPNARAFHTTNLIFHILNTCLVFGFIYLLTMNQTIAFVAGLLFGVHTLHVESVAWVSERKDVLYTFFFLASLMQYILFVKRGKRKYFIFSLFLFLLSCLSKGQAVSLALSVVLIDFFMRRKLTEKEVIIEKLPFFIIALIFGIIAVNAQKSAEAIFDNVSRSFFDRILFAGYGFVNYILKLIYPYKLSAIYPYPQKGQIPFTFWLCLPIAIGISVLFIKSLKKNKMFFFATGFFIVNIIMVLQLLPVGNVIMADRYAYIPSIGFFFLAGVSFDKIVKEKKQFKTILNVLLAAYIIILISLTFKRCDVWQTGISLWTDVVSKYPEAEVAWNNRGSMKNNDKDYQGALLDYNEAIKIDQLYADAYANRGMTKKNLGDYKGAVDDLDICLKMKPNYAFAYSTKGIALNFLNELAKARAYFDTALKFDSNSADAYSGRGVVKTKTGDLPGALADLNKALQLLPDQPETLSNRGIAKAEAGDKEGAVADFTKAIALKPDYAGSYLNRGMTYMKFGVKDAACNDFQAAAQLGSQQAAFLVQKNCNQ